MKKIILIITFLIYLPIAAQVQFEKGYVIDNNGQKIECLIKNKDWNTVPDEIEYKISDTTEVLTGTVNDLIEFRINNTNHYYKKFTFSFDKNYNDNSKNIENITSFLRILVEGQASLYEYKGYTFLYSNKDANVKQLVFKKYEDDENNMRDDLAYQKELFINLKIFNNKINVSKLKYSRSDLAKYFIAYNISQNAEFTDYNKIVSKNKMKIKFNVFGGAGTTRIRRGDIINYTQTVTISNPPSAGGGITVHNNTNTIYFKDQNLKNYNLGFETEFLLPFNRYKWAVFMSPSYFFQEGSEFQYYEKTYNFETYRNVEINKINYFQIPIGLKHYFYINNKSKLNIGVAYNLNSMKQDVFFTVKDINTLNYPTNFENSNNTKLSNSFSFSTAYTYNKYSIGVNYYPSNEIKQGGYTIKLNTIEVLLKYNIF